MSSVNHDFGVMIPFLLLLEKEPQVSEGFCWHDRVVGVPFPVREEKASGCRDCVMLPCLFKEHDFSLVQLDGQT